MRRTRIVDNSHVPHELKMQAKKAARKLNALVPQGPVVDEPRAYSETEMKAIYETIDQVEKPLRRI